MAKHKKWRRTICIYLALMLLAAVSVVVTPHLVKADGPPPTIEISAPSNISSWTLTPQGTGLNTQTGTLTVTTTNADGKAWSVTASDADTENTTGYMTRYQSGTYYTGTKLLSAMEVQGEAGSVTLPDPGYVVTGNGNVSQGYAITFKQTVLWNDTVLNSPYYYHIVVTFTASITL